jgi:putative acyl-CoA dehydrogenase
MTRWLLREDRVNQTPPYVDVDLYTSDQALVAAVAANGGAAAAAELAVCGRRWGAEPMLELGREANESPPKLRAFDGQGFRRDMVEFHPAYHRLMVESIGIGLHASTWRVDLSPQPAPEQVTRAARFYMAAQVETGHLCPLTMTRAAAATLTVEPALAARLAPGLTSRRYDASFKPWTDKAGLTLGMGMTERQGGTDVRTNTTRAVPADEAYAVAGQKWFMSAPMCDAFLILAQAPGGLTCFLLPRFRPDGAVNGIHLLRLKNKLGNRSNASAEVELADAFAWRIGEEGRGVRTIINMVQLTRVDCAVASAGLMRMALAQAIHHARHRTVFQRHIVDQPTMQGVLADMALEVEAATALVMRLCRAYDLAAAEPREAARARLLTPAVKYWVCKVAPALCAEAMECLGGNGYVEESVMPRLYREAPVNAIWEGSGNVMCLDVLRALAGEAETAALAELAQEVADLPGGRRAVEHVRAGFAEGEQAARSAVGGLARIAAAAAMRACAPDHVVESFARSRLAADRTEMLGEAAIAPTAARALIERALPSP